MSDEDVRGPLPPPDGPSRRIGPYEQSLRDQSKQVARAVARRAARRRRTRILAGLLAVVLLGGGAYAAMTWFGGTEAPSFTSSTSAVPTHCDNPSTVTVAVPAAMGPALTEVTAALANSEDGPCTTFELTSAEAPITYRTLGTAARPQAWVTDSSIWVEEANAAGSKLKAAEPFATSAIVVAMSPDRAESLKFAPKWADLATGKDAVRFPDPSRSTVGVLSLAAVGSGISAKSLDTIVTAAAKTPATTVEPASLAKAELAVPVAEAALVEYNRGNPAGSLAAVAPKDGTAPLEYSLVSTTADEASAAAIEALATYLRSDAAKEILADHGFRVPGAAAPTAAEPLVGSITMAAKPSPQLLTQVRKLWNSATPQRQVLVALDVSGSMLSRTERGTRLALAQDAIRVSMASLPETATTAFWVFSNHIGQRDDFLPLTRYGTMSDARHRAALEKGVAGLDKTVGGGRGLYDSILASYTSAQDSFAAGRVNSVVVVVDGPNEDDYGLDFRRLRIQLTTLRNAARPVRLVFVGIGSKPPVAELKELTNITGGGYIAVEKPEDLGSALVQAVTGS